MVMVEIVVSASLNLGQVLHDSSTALSLAIPGGEREIVLKARIMIDAVVVSKRRTL
jgi:hypothetical protein